MAGDELGSWHPLRPDDAVVEFEAWTMPWWIAGGWAIDLLLGSQSREHGDLDILVLRRDHLRVRAHLAGWDVHAADPPGTLRPWPVGEALPTDVHDIWCRRDPGSPWAFQLMIDDTDGEAWLFRRDHRIRRPITSLAGRASSPERAVLAPEIQLLYKSKGLRPKDHADFTLALPHLSEPERDWLKRSLGAVTPEHPWIAEL